MPDIMDQYRPCGEFADKAVTVDIIGADMYQQAVNAAERLGLTRLDRKDISDLIRRLFSSWKVSAGYVFVIPATGPRHR